MKIFKKDMFQKKKITKILWLNSRISLINYESKLLID